MLATTEGIVLHTVKYGENSIIATIYTRDFGRQGFLLNATHGKKSKNKAALLQPMFLVSLVAYEKQSREIQRVKEISALQNYQTIPFDIIKSSQAVFIAEILFKTIAEQESNPDLFDFIKNTFLYFDLMNNGVANFHFFFLFRLTEYLGFLPDVASKVQKGWFDMRKGEIVAWEPTHPMYLNREATELLTRLSTCKINELASLAISSGMRGYLVNNLVEYYHLHFGNLSEIKSLKVLHEVFN